MKRFLCGVLVLGLSASLAHAKPPKKPKAAASAKMHILVPFDISLNAISSEFEGNPGFLLYHALEQRQKQTKKDEFETSAEHAERVKALEDKPLLGKIRLTDRVVFVAKDYPEIAYDADEQSISGGLSNYGIRSFIELRLDSSSKQIGQYVGSNAFGVKRAVRKYADTWLNLAFSIPSGETHGETFYLPKIDLSPYLAGIKCETEKRCKGLRSFAAYSATRFSRVLITGFLTEPYISRDSNETTATIDDPEERFSVTHRIHISPDQVWVYDPINDVVLKKIDFNEVWGKR